MRRLRITPGFWLLCALIWAMEPGLLLPTALAAALHELGHCAVLKLTGNGVARLRLSALGAELTPKRPLSYAQQLPAALAGPAVSFLCAFWAAKWGFFLFAGISLALGIFNLLPIAPLDGGRAFGSLCALTLPAPLDRGVPKWLAVGLAGLILGAAVAAFFRFALLSLLVLALWLCAQSVKDLLDG